MTNDIAYILTITCPDRGGIVAAVSTFLHEQQFSITEAHQHSASEGLFCMRLALAGAAGSVPDVASLAGLFAPIAARFGMTARFHDTAVRPRVLLMVSNFGHCLHDLLHRWRAGQLPVDIVGVGSNHDTLRSFVEWCGVPWHHLPISDGKAAQEQQLIDLTEALAVDLVVLARYMQVLSPTLCAAWAGRCINIHHSFLPSFKGARPYTQAHDRGVKIIGATAHYVTTDLDEGPIIEQDIRRVSHTRSPAELVTMGQEVEASVLTRAVRWHAERRVFAAGQRTVVFD
ncbi:MAG: formyltetrahydrofolate deformylase [Alphaproteobacteria bacterium]|nr:MAG: formyltetrahydrofolate deformylase [Alphaproteobacteria bacterium]